MARSQPRAPSGEAHRCRHRRLSVPAQVTRRLLNLALGDWLKTLSPVVRTFVLATVAVPIVIHVLMPHLHRLRARVLTRRNK